MPSGFVHNSELSICIEDELEWPKKRTLKMFLEWFVNGLCYGVLNR